MKAKYNFNHIVGNSDEIFRCIKLAKKAALSNSPVLIYGETGTGKELFVQSIHNSSKRKDKPFMVENCGAIPYNLFESIFFGSLKGGYTDAVNRKGLFEASKGGTLYLDELNSMPVALQAKLLRVIEEGEYKPVGANTIYKTDVRIIASLNEHPKTLIKEGKLREDLYYRLAVFRIDIPPLRERKEDIPALVDFFIEEYNHKFNGNIKGIKEEALKIIIRDKLYGNVRELKHLIESMFNMKKEGFIEKEDLKEVFNSYNIDETLDLKERLNKLERELIMEAMALSKNNVSEAAKLLNIPRQTLQYKLKRIYHH